MKTSRNWTAKKVILLVYDLVITILAIFFAILLVDEKFDQGAIFLLKNYWFLFPLTAFPIFYFSGFYDQMWVYASIHQYVLLGAGAMLHTLVITFIMQILRSRFAYAVYILYFFILCLGLAGIRLCYRVYSTYMRRKYNQSEIEEWEGNASAASGQREHIRVLVIGAGSAGSQIIKELKSRQSLRIPVAIIDDNPLTHSYKNQGVPVVGGRRDIPEAVEKYHIDEIILAIPSAPSREVRDIFSYCTKTGKKVRIIPFLPQVLSGKVALSDVRDVEIEDLLGRDPIKLDQTEIRSFISGKVVLVTGGGGSIGSELSRQIAKYIPKTLILFDIYENNVYDLQQELKSKYGADLNLKVLIGSVRDKARLREIFSEYHPQIIFHAAAHKHVPLMEESRGEVIKNNIFGTLNVAEVAGEMGAQNMVLISTDKAVNPTNAMGASKRLSEMIMLAMNKRYPDCKFSMVRFGNVLGSNGSVIPLFKRQIKEERRVTVTDPNIRRYFMTIPEAASLVLQAACFAEGGEIYVLDMGESVKIDDLARQLIRLSGYEPDVDIPVEYIGLRPGEKMFEELHLDMEELDKTKHKKIFVLQQVHEREALRRESQSLMNLIHYESPELEALSEQIIDDICS